MTIASLEVDTNQAELFLEALMGDGWETKECVWQTFDDNKERRRTAMKTARLAGAAANDALARVICGPWSQVKSKLITLNLNGAGVYITGNACAKGRRIENLTEYRAVWLDWDQPEKPLPQPTDWPLSPHIQVMTSTGKYQLWWRVSDLDNASHWQLCRILADQYEGDKRAIDAVHVLRVPGFYHQKSTPILSRLDYAESWHIGQYTVAEMRKSFGAEAWEAEQAEQRRKKPPQGSGKAAPKVPLDVERTRAALAVIIPDDRDIWLKMGMALASTGQAAAFGLWDEWSQRSTKYDEDDQYRVWRSFRESRSDDHANPITLGTLFKTARLAGWKPAVENWQDGLLRTKDGEIKDCPFNVAQIIRRHPQWQDRIRRNLLTGRVEIDGEAMQESDIFACLEWCGSEARLGVRNISIVYATLNKIADEQGYNPVADYLNGLPAWDGTTRIDYLFADILGAAQGEYGAHVARVLFCGLVERAFTPGCIMRHVPVLVGPERIGKSRFVRDIGWPWSGEISSCLEGKQIMEDIRGLWVAELMEMDALRKASASRIKAFISQRNDRYRPPYGHLSEDHPRVTCFVGTVNPNQAQALFQSDDENTRFYPLAVTGYDSAAFATVRDQIFAEALHIVARTPTWWLESDPVEAVAEQERVERTIVDPWVEPIEDYLIGKQEVTIKNIMDDCLKIPLDRATNSEPTRIGKILNSLGWTIARRTRASDGKRTRVYHRARWSTE